MKKRNYILAVLICCVILFLPILSKNYIVGHMKHRCVTNDCGICMELEIAAQAIQTIQTLSVLSAGILIIFAVFSLERKIGQKMDREKKTLIGLKVEMLN